MNTQSSQRPNPIDVLRLAHEILDYCESLAPGGQEAIHPIALADLRAVMALSHVLPPEICARLRVARERLGMADEAEASPAPLRTIGRTSRLHDRSGAPVGPSRLLRNGPRALVTTLLRSIGRCELDHPWFSFDAARAVARHLTARSVALEYGAGLSTLWLARRCRHVFSVEHDESWYTRVSHTLRERAIRNVTLMHRPSREGYIRADEACEEAPDLVVVDGAFRYSSTMRALQRARDGGLIYLDDVDYLHALPAERLAAEVQRRQGRVELFRDFFPGQVRVRAGLLARLPPDRARRTA